MQESLGIVCDHLLYAPDHKHAEMIKSIENAYRHMGITLANQLTLAYPGINMTEVLKLVGTKWNIETYHPSFGTGGYCIPLSSQYVLLGADRPEKLTLLENTVNTDRMFPGIVSDSLIARGAKKVGVLGLAYKGDLKVHILSPAIKIVERLKEHGVEVKLHDPYYTAEEIKQILGVPTFEFPEGLKEFDTLVIVSDHRMYLSTPDREIKSNMEKCRLILDNTELWKHIDFGPSMEYHVAGDINWLGDA
jgi:nucleotide sugar dehydrogenase